MSLLAFPKTLVRAICATLVSVLVFGPGSTLSASAFDPDRAVGALNVGSDPAGADVYVDGRLAGRTPLTLEAISVGDHRVRVVKSGYLENSRIVEVGRDRAHAVTVKLTRYAAGSTASAAAAPGGGSKKWLWIALIAGGAGVAALALGSKTSTPSNRAPVVNAVTASTSTGLAAATSITFTAAGASDPDGSALSYSWDFGNGTSSTSPNPSAVFPAAGTFTVTVTVSDGSASASASTTVTIRSMSGTWRGSLFNGTFSLTQSGTSITGSYSDVDGPGSITGGSVTSASPNVRFTINQPQIQFVANFQGSPDSTANVITGTLADGGASVPFTITRQ